MDSELTLALDFLEQKLNHAFSKRCFAGILGANQKEEREEKGTKYQTIRKARREKIES